MRALAWICVGLGILSTVASFVITAHTPVINPWPSLVAGFGLTTFGVIVLTRRGAN